jgi:hypothetical protein
MFHHVHSALDHGLLKTIGALWAAANVVHFGWDLVSALGPILIGVGSIWAAWNKQQERKDRQRAEAKQKA